MASDTGESNDRSGVKPDGIKEYENGENNFPRELWVRCEFHRNAFALLPEWNDKTPGTAYLCLGKKKEILQRFCTCSFSTKRTCQHLLDLSNLLKQMAAHGDLRKQYGHFEQIGECLEGVFHV